MADTIATAHRGERVDISISVTDATGAAMDLTGRTLRFYAARSYGAAPLITKSTGAGIVHAADQTANRGKATITLVPGDTTPLANIMQVLACALWLDDGAQPYVVLPKPGTSDEFQLVVKRAITT